MDRRRYLTGIGALGGALAGCLADGSDDSSGPDLTPPDDRDVQTVASATFEEDVTPICADGESISGSVEGSNAEYVSAHQFFHDEPSGRYGVRGRIEPGQRGNVPRVYASFSNDASAGDGIEGLDDDEAYLFTTTTTEGDPDAVDDYTLTVRDGQDADVGHVPEGYATIEGEWGEIGHYDGDSVYGCAATVTNDRDEPTKMYPRCKAYLDESTVAYSGSPFTSFPELQPGATETAYFPYPRCDPGAVTEVDLWLEWNTMNRY